MAKQLILCDCLGSQTLDPKAIQQSTGLQCSRVNTALCLDEIGIAAQALEAGDAVIACGQEQSRFADLAEELGVDAPACVDLRDRAGWSDEAKAAGAKQAALVAEALLPAPQLKTVDVISEGTCLIVGGAAALDAAGKLADALAVTVLLVDETDPVEDPRFDIVRGRIKTAKGALGQFELILDELRMRVPGGRGAPGMTAPKDGAQSACDIILDLSGTQPLFPAHHKREGYLRADPKSQPAVSEAILQAVQLVGTFEKPLYVRLTESLCAHSRAEQVACSNCLDICPTGAIAPAGEHVAIDPMVCAGCGACAALCPSEAIAYDAPPVSSVFARLNTLARTFRGAGGQHPRLLVHDAEHGRTMIELGARYGRGLPAQVIPFEVDALTGFGHAEMLAALGAGFAHVDILLSPKTEREPLEREAALAGAIKPAVRLLDLADPDELSSVLYDTHAQTEVEPILPLGGRRQVTKLAARALMPDAAQISLPDSAPYGAVLVDTDACTLCLSCVSLCPSGALVDNEDLPQLRFQEDACLQCGLCANICPEDAITYETRLNLDPSAMDQVVLHEEEPFPCIECGAPFGVKSTVERIMEKLSGHAMFATSDRAKMIQMCDNCRIQAQYHSSDNPFEMGERPRVRTTEDYLSKRRDH